jgi:hypothetical protein
MYRSTLILIYDKWHGSSKYRPALDECGSKKLEEYLRPDHFDFYLCRLPRIVPFRGPGSECQLMVPFCFIFRVKG